MPDASFSYTTAEDNESYEVAGDLVQKMAANLITEFPSDLGHLLGQPMKILLRKKKRVWKGRKVLESAKAFSGVDNFLHPFAFLIVLDKLTWEASPDDRRPLLFRALCRCQRHVETGQCYIREPEVGFFFEEVTRFGIWNTDIKAAKEQLAGSEEKTEQLELK